MSERISGYEKETERAANNPKAKESFAGMVLNGKKYMNKEKAGKEILELCTRLTLKHYNPIIVAFALIISSFSGVIATERLGEENIIYTVKTNIRLNKCY